MVALKVCSVPLLQCQGCRATVDPSQTLAFSCPMEQKHPDAEHMLVPMEECVSCLPSHEEAPDGDNPFARFRHRFYLYRFALSVGLTDKDWLEMVQELDSRLETLDHAYVQTPLRWHEDLGVWAKDETGQVGQSHKSRHFFLAMLYVQTLLRAKCPAGEGLRQRRLAVASCGNAAVGAATMAAAADWPIDVYIPDDAQPIVVERLTALGATVHICPKADNARLGGDATVFACREVVSKGNISFTLQNNGLASEGTATLVWEALEQLANSGVKELGSVVIQVGGGALSSGILTGLRRAKRSGEIASLPTLHTVQAIGCGPLARCYKRLIQDIEGADIDSAGGDDVGVQEPVPEEQRRKVIDAAAASRDEFMYPWEDPHSVAHGVLDDETYDWAHICDGMLETAGSASLVTDVTIRKARADGKRASEVPMCHTGSVGLAGVQHMRVMGNAPKEPVLVVFSGLSRDGIE